MKIALHSPITRKETCTEEVLYGLSELEGVFDYVEKDDVVGVSSELRHLIPKLNTRLNLPVEFLCKTLSALQNSDWSFFSASFQRKEFLSELGFFLIIAPYTIRRQGKPDSKLSAIYGKIIPHDKVDGMLNILEGLFGEVREEISVVLPIEVYGGAGYFCRESGEAFIVPDGWPGVTNGNGPPLNDMIEQQKRFSIGGMQCIQTIFDEQSADLLLSWTVNESESLQIRYSEYQFHDSGHAAGIGLKNKLSANVLSSPWYRGVEEWRADGVGLEVAKRSLTQSQCAELIASNMVTRFGLDSHRAGGLDRDTDVASSLQTFYYLLEGGSVRITRTGKLSFVNPTRQGLCQAIELMCASAISLTRNEMSLSYIDGIGHLYGSRVIPQAVKILFCTHILRPCEGIYSELR